MNAQPHATAHAIATALAHASSAESASAKRKHNTAQDRTAPNGVFAWGEFPSILTLGDAAALERLTARFWAKVDIQPGDSCWKWMGEVNHRGYGRFTFGARRTVAHRVAYELANGPVPAGLQCGHLCHNPRCVRPDHLEAMTCAENIRQRDERMGRTGSPVSPSERNRRWRERQKAKRAAELIEAGEWVCI